MMIEMLPNLYGSRILPTLEVDDSNMMVYQFCRVPFRLICSPFLLAATIKYHLQKEDSSLATHIQNNIYVDNVLIGVKSANEAYEKYKEAKLMFEKASMNLSIGIFEGWQRGALPLLNFSCPPY